MKQDKALEGLQKLTTYADDAVPGLIELIRFKRRTANLSFCHLRLAGVHEIYAMKAKYVQGDDQQFRQHMHVACKLKIESIRLDKMDIPFQTSVEMWLALLSDSPDVIDTVSRLEPAHFAHLRDGVRNPQFGTHMWQLAIRGDYEALEAKVQRVAKSGGKQQRLLSAEGRDFFTLLMRADKAGLEERITKDARLRNDDPTTQDFFTYLATLEAKLCWYRGIEVQIDSDRVPMDLMPVRPLARYDDLYDFLKPGWVPPRQGWLGKIERLFTK
ncbi:hypothetical protein SNE35_12650 [Paucibacter sp. R3-3]|uniref:Uncharacterized protein n=1 Tax=Roseateles agri TaxID=3098619 RepID=A0ABU5DGE4_9BURK|nr:Imm49 family immunity protein [Paucibacter sp. R3-3]MDY0745363.1 hypothetical protein [Paucibacter sp. R3-3]